MKIKYIANIYIKTKENIHKMKLLNSLLLIFLFTICINYSYSQTVINKETIFEDSRLGVKIELNIRIPKKACDPTNFKSASFSLYVTNFNNIHQLKQYLNWKMDFVNCNGDIVEKTISVDLYNAIKNEGQNSNSVWEFDGNAVEKSYYNVSNSSFSDNSKDFAKAKAKSLAPDSINGSSSIVLGESVTLSVSGGSLTKDAKWVWYSGACPNGVKEGEGPSLTKINVSKTTVFFVRAEGSRNNTDCIFKKVSVDNNSRPADAIEGKSMICQSQNNNKILLYVVGGKKGLNAKWVWYKNNCNAGSPLDSGDSIYVNPDKTTTYYVRAEGPTINPSTCVSHTIEVFSPSIKPNAISVKQDNKCANQPVLLKVEGGKLSDNAKWIWRSKLETNFAPREEGEGDQLTVSPDAAINYYVSAQDDICPSTEEISVMVPVKSISLDPTRINVQHMKRNWYKLTVEGGQLGENAKWVWYKNNCGSEGERIASGESTIDYKAKKSNNTIYLRGEGDCNTTSCISTNAYDIARMNKTKKNFWFINAGIVGQSVDNFNNFVVSFGCKWVYISTKFSLEKGDKYYYDNAIPTGIYGLPTGAFAELTDKKFYTRTSYTGGFMIGGGVFRIYLGGGIGSYQNVKQFKLYNTSESPSTEYAREGITKVKTSPEAEGGIFLKLGSFTIMGGVSSLFINEPQSSQFMDGHITIGFKL